MRKARVLIFLVTVFVVVVLGYLTSLYARGYRFDSKKMKFSPTGLLVTKSSPDGAQVLVNGEIKTATNANLALTPGVYDITIKKEGFRPWNKRLSVEKEVVTEADAFLFRLAPSLSALTFSGCVSPTISRDSSKIAYAVPASTENVNQDKEGLWVIETVNLPLGFARDPRRITDGDLKDSTWIFSPDGRQILLSTQSGKYLLDTGVFNPQTKRVNIASTIDKTFSEWKTEEDNIFKSQTRGLPEPLLDILTNSVEYVTFSPDETRILYKSKADTTIEKGLIKPLPGASTQKEARDIRAGQTYVYDIKEDKNFFITDQDTLVAYHNQTTSTPSSSLRWFPTSKHLLLAQPDKVIIMDYDGTNQQEVYSGSYLSPNAFPVVSPDRILILTNLGSSNSLSNLYSLSLK